jgi:hypothetical protein
MTRRRFSLPSILVAAALAACASLAARDAGADGPPAAAAPPIDVTAKLVEIPTKFPSDELYDYAYVMRYQVVGGAMDGQSILVAHYKPRLPRAGIKDQMKKVVSGKVRSFHVGDVHKLRLAPDLKAIWKGALVDEFAATDHKSIRYFALVADPA